MAAASPGSVPYRVSVSASSGALLLPLNSSMIALAIVAIAAQFGASAGVAWIISAMYIATAVTGPLAGRMGTLFGARRVYLAGLALVAAASAVGAMAQGVPWLIAAYALLGVGASAQMPNAMTLIRSYAERRGRQVRTAVMILTICSQVTAALGPTIGGVLVGTFSWHAILWVNVPVSAVSAVLVLRFGGGESERMALAPDRQARAGLDFPGAVMFAASIALLLILLATAADEIQWWLLPAVLLSGILFVLHELRVPNPIIDVRAMLGNLPLRKTLWRTALVHVGHYSVYFGFVQWLQYTRGLSPVVAGLVMLPVAGAGIFASLAATRAYRVVGARMTLLVGVFSLLGGGLALALIVDERTSIVMLLAVATMFGITNGYSHIGNQNYLNAAIPLAEVGSAFGMYRTVQYVAANLAVTGLVLMAGPVIGDTGLTRVGWLIVALAGVLILDLFLARDMRRGERS